MPRFISKEGVLHPAIEKVGLTNHSDKPIKNPSTMGPEKGKVVGPGEPYIYHGPDRAALLHLHNEKSETLGSNFRTNPDFLAYIRGIGFKSVEEYLESIGYDSEKVNKDFESKMARLKQDEIKEKAEAVKTLGGGADLSGGGNVTYGDFGTPKDYK